MYNPWVPKYSHLTTSLPTSSSWSREYRSEPDSTTARTAQFVLVRGVMKRGENSYKEGWYLGVGNAAPMMLIQRSMLC